MFLPDPQVSDQPVSYIGDGGAPVVFGALPNLTHRVQPQRYRGALTVRLIDTTVSAEVTDGTSTKDRHITDTLACPGG